MLALAGHVAPARVGAGVGEEGGERWWHVARGRKHAGGGGKRGVGRARARSIGPEGRGELGRGKRGGGPGRGKRRRAWPGEAGRAGEKKGGGPFRV